MAILVKGKTFTSTEQVTSTKLHQLVDSATFDPAAADGSTLEVSAGALRVKDAGITTAKLASGLTVVHATGSAAAPSVTASGDTDTGVYFSTNAVNVSCGGTQTASFTGGVYPAIELAGSSGAFLDLSVGTINTPDFSMRSLADTNGGHLYVSGNKILTLNTNSVERLRVTGSGDVGIGTASPSTKLQVVGDVTATTFIGNLTGTASTATTVSDGAITGAKLSSTVAIPSAATATTQAADTNTTAVATCAFAKAEADAGETAAKAFAIQRANHTGTQSSATITGLGIQLTEYVSAQQSIPASGTDLTMSHGLGGLPRFYQVTYVCAIADHGYSIGDEIGVYSDGGYSDGATSTWMNSTTLGFRRYGTTPIAARGAGSWFSPTTTANAWKLVFRAWK